jgi:ribonucleoside-diphosphate reductase alpha chain
MRSLQFAGRPMMLNPTRGYNCSYAPVDDIKVFSEAMFLLLGGTGFGYSVQRHHVAQLPDIQKPNPRKVKRFLIDDSIEGWSNAIRMLMESYFGKKTCTFRFDYNGIRPKGTPLKTAGGKAPGPLPLKDAIHKIKNILDSKSNGDRLKPIEAHDILCHIADAVLSGGIRRAAMIALFSVADTEMIRSKYGNWWETNPQRGRANNSAVFLRHKITKEVFRQYVLAIREGGSGDPGIFLTNDKDWGTNPCGEIGLRNNQFCNLTEINGSAITDQQSLNDMAYAASFLGTLQAGFTDFHYLRGIWQKNTEKEALLGVSMTGIASNKTKNLDLRRAVNTVLETNEEVADEIGINKAARTTCVKPAGTTSLVLGTSSGIHPWWSRYYIRRITVNKDNPLYRYLSIQNPELIEESIIPGAGDAFVTIPVKATRGASTRHEPLSEMLARISFWNNNWVHPGFRSGENGNNVSATVYVKDNEWEDVIDWVWHNRLYLNGLTLLPHDGGTHLQAPHEEINKEKYLEMYDALKEVDVEAISETEDGTNLNDQAACAGGSCEIT